MRRALALVLLGAAACGGDAARDICTAHDEKEATLALAREWYLYPDLLPAGVDVDAYADTEALVDALTARARDAGMDRGWTFVASNKELSDLSAGAAVGYGVQLAQREGRLFIADVFSGSAAAEAGFARGDEILAVGESAETLVPVATLVAGDMVGQAFGPAQSGVTRTFDVMAAAGRATRTMSKRAYSIDPVPVATLLPRPGLAPVGYMVLRSFIISDAATRLPAVFGMFKDAGVTDVIVDLRYNGGGSTSIAQQLASLLGAGLVGQTLIEFDYNSKHAADTERVLFTNLAGAVAATHIAFITTGGSASASELVPNALEPYVPIALVGSRTYGKPVGQMLFDLNGCDAVVGLISFRLRNAQGDGDYFQGLPAAGFDAPLCDAPDDLGHAFGDPLEGSTAAALAWLASGKCPAAAKQPRAPDVYPAPRSPTLAQRELPGLF